MKASTASAHTVLILEATWLQQGRTLGEADNRFPYGTSRSLYRAKAIYMRIEGDRERKASHFVKGHFSPIALRPELPKGLHFLLWGSGARVRLQVTAPVSPPVQTLLELRVGGRGSRVLY